LPQLYLQQPISNPFIFPGPLLPQAGPLVEALASKYVALTDEELQEWQDDPEGYIR
jgi:hypothetical protein